ncbi:MAG: hypothetical protein HQL81_03235 [Magnetococcales bacterium]|nr:hypothetical protein [Magnetococcales bacterium]
MVSEKPEVTEKPVISEKPAASEKPTVSEPVVASVVSVAGEKSKTSFVGEEGAKDHRIDGQKKEEIQSAGVMKETVPAAKDVAGASSKQEVTGVVQGGIVEGPLSVVALAPLRVEPVNPANDEWYTKGEVFPGAPGEAPFTPGKVAIVRYWQMPYTMIPDDLEGSEAGFSISAPDDHHVRFFIGRMLGRTVFCEGEQFELVRGSLSEMGLFIQIIPREAFFLEFDPNGVVTIPRSFWNRIVASNGKWVTVSRVLRKSEDGAYHIRDIASKKIVDIQKDIEDSR